MPTNNARKHSIPSGGDASVSRETIFQTFAQSINDVVPVANATERSALVSDLTSAGVGPSSTKPLVVTRADNPGLHRLEYTYDGTNWLPGSGVLHFADLDAANTWALTNGSLLTIGDRAIIETSDARWAGGTWHVNGQSATPTLATGWSTASQNVIRRYNGIAFLTFNAARSSDSSVDGVAVSIPAGYRGNQNAYQQAWGLLGAPASIQCWYDASAHQIKLRQTILSGQSIALTMQWPITS